MTEPETFTLGGQVFTIEPVSTERLLDALDRSLIADLHAPGCPACDLARVIVDDFGARYDPLDNWRDITVNGVNEHSLLVAQAAERIHEFLADRPPPDTTGD